MPSIVSDWAASGCIDGNGVATLRCIPVVIQNLVNSLVVIAGIVCVFIIIFAGYKIITSEGDPEKLKTARKTVFYGIGGFLFVLISFLLLNLIGNFTGVEQIKTGPIPTP